MKIAVCLKFVNGELGPMEEAALEAALRVENAEVCALSMAPMSAQSGLMRVSRLGVKTYLLNDTAFAGADTLATAYALSLAIGKIAPDCVFLGRQSVDGDTAQVGPMLASMLGWEFYPYVTEFRENVVMREEARKLRLPAVLAFERVYSLRSPSLFSSVQAPILLSAHDLNADEQRCGQKGSGTRVLRTYENVRGRRSCVFLPPDRFSEAVMLAGERAKKGASFSVREEECSPKTERVVAVGDAALQAVCKRFAEEADLWQMTSKEDLLARIGREKPNAVLFAADEKSRVVAPEVAARLNVGLCADCTDVRIREGRIVFSRPARGGNTVADIECTRFPVMATLRTGKKTGGLIADVGLGALGLLDRIKRWCEGRKGTLMASRAAVDCGKLPYALQIGLTGRAVAPDTLVAFGVSGAVQHTCAVEGAGTIIAVNPDKNARIFDYADFGFVARAEEIQL